MMSYIEDWILAFLQKRCDHPGKMVSADILEGDVRGVAIKYCNRCGSVKAYKTWRRPDPNLWRG